MITIKEATLVDIPAIQEIAHKTWPVVYGSIISQSQIDYMLNLFYATDVLEANMTQQNHSYLLVIEGSLCFGFAAFEPSYLNKNRTRLHKLYILPESQGKGFGRLLMENIENLALNNYSSAISLNVNRYNPAFTFYKRMGFEIVAEEDLEIGHGYLMEDYKMEKQL